jgi:hypothetical protein
LRIAMALAGPQIPFGNTLAKQRRGVRRKCDIAALSEQRNVADATDISVRLWESDDI